MSIKFNAQDAMGMDMLLTTVNSKTIDMGTFLEENAAYEVFKARQEGRFVVPKPKQKEKWMRTSVSVDAYNASDYYGPHRDCPACGIPLIEEWDSENDCIAWRHPGVMKDVEDDVDEVEDECNDECLLEGHIISEDGEIKDMFEKEIEEPLEGELEDCYERIGMISKIPQTIKQYKRLKRRIGTLRRIIHAWNKKAEVTDLNFLKTEDVIRKYFRDAKLSKWILDNWDAITMKDEESKSVKTEPMPLVIDEEGNAIGREWPSDVVELSADWAITERSSNYSNDENKFLRLAATSILVSPEKVLKQANDKAAAKIVRPMIRDVLKDIAEYAEEAAFMHPRKIRWIKSKQSKFLIEGLLKYGKEYCPRKFNEETLTWSIGYGLRCVTINKDIDSNEVVIDLKWAQDPTWEVTNTVRKYGRYIRRPIDADINKILEYFDYSRVKPVKHVKETKEVKKHVNQVPIAVHHVQMDVHKWMSKGYRVVAKKNGKRLDVDMLKRMPNSIFINKSLKLVILIYNGEQTGRAETKVSQLRIVTGKYPTLKHFIVERKSVPCECSPIENKQKNK